MTAKVQWHLVHSPVDGLWTVWCCRSGELTAMAVCPGLLAARAALRLLKGGSENVDV